MEPARSQVEDQCLELGARFERNLSKECTHLIATSTQSQKYAFAVKYGICTVSKKWVEECVRLRLHVDETKFPVTDVVESESKDANSVRHERCLDGCVAYLGAGFTNDQLDTFSTLLEQMGAKVLDAFSTRVTHFIVSGKALLPDDRTLLSKHSKTPLLVQGRWIRTCFKSKSRVDTSLFEIEYQPEKEPVVEEIEPVEEEQLIEQSSQTMAANPLKLKKKTDLSLHGFSNMFGFGAIVEETNQSSALSNNNSRSGIFGFQQKTKPVLSLRQALSSEMSKSRATETTTSGTTVTSRTTTSTVIETSNQSTSTTASIGTRKSEAIRLTRLFDGWLFCGREFTEHQHTILEKTIRIQGGKYTEFSLAETEPMDETQKRLYLVPFNCQSRLDARHTVTELWLERCLDEGRIVDFDEVVFYRPLRIETPLHGFESYMIGITGYDGLERQHLGKLVTRLGGKFTENFTRKNTHLLCKERSGVKYEKALQWKIPAVDRSWLLGFVEGAPPAVMDDIVEDSNQSKPAVSAGDDFTGGLQDAPDPGNETTRCNDVSILNQLADQTLEEKTRTDIDPGSFLEALTPAAAPARQRSWHRDSIVSNGTSGTGTPLLDKVTKGIEKAASAPSPATLNLLEGVRVCISLKLIHRRDEIRNVTLELGGLFLGESFREQCTHYIHQSIRENDPFKDFKVARKKKKFIVSPIWLMKCREEKRRVNEAMYPHNFNPETALNVMVKTREDAIGLAGKKPSDSAPSESREPVAKENKKPFLEKEDAPKPGFDTVLNSLIGDDSRLTKTKSASPRAAFDASLLDETTTFNSTTISLSRELGNIVSKRKLMDDDDEDDAIVYDDPEGAKAREALRSMLNTKRTRV